MRTRLIAVLIANAVSLPVALAADQDTQSGISGSVEVGAVHTNINAKDSSKAEEYRDLGNGAIGNFEFKLRGEQNYLNVFGENLTRNDQYFNLQGGNYGVFKYGLFENELVHNLSNGLSPYTSGVGGAVLNGTFPNANTATWTAVDFALTRKDVGGYFEFSNNSPWYVRTDANQVTTNGLKPMGGSMSVASPGRVIELTAPVNYKTYNFSIETGYNFEKGLVTANFTQSKFENAFQNLYWRDPVITNAINQPFSTLAPDNLYSQFSANGVLRELPYNSTLAARFTYGKQTNSVAMVPSYVINSAAAGTGVTQLTNASSSVFSGNTVNESASVSLNSQLAQAFQSHAYYNYNHFGNYSTPMSFTGQTVTCDGSTTCTNTLFAYTKNNVGFDLNYRLKSGRKVAGGLDYLYSSQVRNDYSSNKDWKTFVEYKDASLFGADWVGGRIRYQYLDRNANSLLPNNLVLQGANPINGAFDLASVRQNLVKLVLDVNPKPFLDIGLEGIYKHNNYVGNNFMGRTGDKRQELYLNGAYGDPAKLRLSAYVDIEFVETDASHRYTSGTAGNCVLPGAGGPGCDASNPSISAAGGYYNWTDRNIDRNWAVGLGADWSYSEKLKFKASAMVESSNGTENFTAQVITGGNVNNLLPLLTGSRKQSFNLKSIYTYDKNIEFTGGYAFQYQHINDPSYTGLPFVLGAATSAGAAYFTGAFANPNYTFNTVYLMGKYKF